MPSSECQGEIVGHLQASHPRVLTKPIPHYKILPIFPSLLDCSIHKSDEGGKWLKSNIVKWWTVLTTHMSSCLLQHTYIRYTFFVKSQHS